jgi:hypothetical protein
LSKMRWGKIMFLLPNLSEMNDKVYK